MRLTNRFLGILLVGISQIVMTSLVACSKDDSGVAGGVTDIGNSIASGVVVDASGKSVSQARVVAYYDSWMQQGVRDSAETRTDDSGFFELPVDYSENIVLYASAGEESGFAALQDSSVANAITVDKLKSYSGHIAGRSSGTVRIVGSSVVASLDDDGYFIFYDMPSGEITISYQDSSDVSNPVQSRIQFTTSGENLIYVLPELELFKDDSSWLVSSRGDYYRSEGYDNIQIYQPTSDLWKIPSDSSNQMPDTASLPLDTVSRTLLSMDGSETVYDDDSTLASEVDWVDGISGNAILLKPGQFVDLDSLDICSGDFTVSLWTRWLGPNGNHQILLSQRAYWSDSTSRFQWHFESSKGRFTAMRSAPGVPYGVYFGDSSIVPVGQWSNLVLVYENQQISMYVNGQVVSFEDSEGNLVTSAEFIPNDLDRKVPLRLGGNEIDTETWNGAIDEVLIENVARSAQWILEQYQRYEVPEE